MVTLVVSDTGWRLSGVARALVARRAIARIVFMATILCGLQCGLYFCQKFILKNSIARGFSYGNAANKEIDFVVGGFNIVEKTTN